MQRTVTQHVDQIGKWLQAYMLETGPLRRGSRVLEIGSGGYFAALLAQIVGDSGVVVSVDIDAEVVANARAGLARAGYPQVQVVHGDGEHGHPDGAPYDAVIVTVEASDLPPAWLDQLAPEGVLIVPLRFPVKSSCRPSSGAFCYDRSLNRRCSVAYLVSSGASARGGRKSR